MFMMMINIIQIIVDDDNENNVEDLKDKVDGGNDDDDDDDSLNYTCAINLFFFSSISGLTISLTEATSSSFSSKSSDFPCLLKVAIEI